MHSLPSTLLHPLLLLLQNKKERKGESCEREKEKEK
jgi:hypothetical protein